MKRIGERVGEAKLFVALAEGQLDLRPKVCGCVTVPGGSKRGPVPSIWHFLKKIEVLCEEYGVTISNTKGRYNERSYDMTLTFDIPSDTAIDSQRLEFEVLAPVFDLTPEDYQRAFTLNGKSFQLVGFKMKNRKYPIIAQDDRGQLYKFEPTVLDKLR